MCCALYAALALAQAAYLRFGSSKRVMGLSKPQSAQLWDAVRALATPRVPREYPVEYRVMGLSKPQSAQLWDAVRALATYR